MSVMLVITINYAREKNHRLEYNTVIECCHPAVNMNILSSSAQMSDIHDQSQMGRRVCLTA